VRFARLCLSCAEHVDFCGHCGTPVVGSARTQWSDWPACSEDCAQALDMEVAPDWWVRSSYFDGVE
jgi:hypothetical protein